MAGSTMVHPSAPNLMSDPEGVAEAQAAFAAGMAASEARQSHMLEPMGGAEARPAESTQQPYTPRDPGDGVGGVT
jgi:hypothetical protein